ncbi:hypothetical protein EON63_08875 [archaeon]|nr:MAG: hypothetical protein EON63_08875 [archaeon]
MASLKTAAPLRNMQKDFLCIQRDVYGNVDGHPHSHTCRVHDSEHIHIHSHHTHVPLPMLDVAHHTIRAACAHGYGDSPFAALHTLLHTHTQSQSPTPSTQDGKVA